LKPWEGKKSHEGSRKKAATFSMRPRKCTGIEVRRLSPSGGEILTGRNFVARKEEALLRSRQERSGTFPRLTAKV